jgi:hypothetical protein
MIRRIQIPSVEDLKISVGQRKMMNGSDEDGIVIYGELNPKDEDALYASLGRVAFTVNKVNIKEDKTEAVIKLLGTKHGKLLQDRMDLASYKIRKDSNNNFITIDAYIQ